MRRTAVIALLAVVVLPAAAAAQGFDVMLRGSAGTTCTARALGAQPFVENKSQPDFDPLDSVNVSGQAAVLCSRQGDPSSVKADSDASSNYSGTIAGAGSDVFGNTLASSITIQVGGNANATATGDVVDGGVGSSALSSAGVLAGFGVLPGTMITVVVTPAGTFDSVTLRGGGALPNNLAGGFSGPATEASGSIEVEFIGSAGARTTPPGAPTFTGTITATVTFGTKPPQGACCGAPGECTDEELQANCTGTFLGDQTLCSAGGCAGAPTPSPTATPPPSTVFIWTNPSGGPYATVANWSPPEEPGSVTGRVDTALFDLGGTYGVDVAGARASRFVIRNGSVDLAGGTAQVTGSSLAAPSLTVGTNGVFNLVSGIFTAVDVGIGEDPTGLAAAAVLDAAAVWTASGRFTVGRANEGLLTITAGRLTSAESRIGGGPARGDAIVGGDFARWETANLGLGFGGADGTLEVRDGGRVVSNDAVIGVEDGPQSLVTVTGSGGQASSWKVQSLEVGAASPGLLEVLAGGRIDFDGITIGNGLLGGGSMRVAGPSSAAVGPAGSLLTVGRLEVGDLVVEDGGRAEAETIFIGGGATGTAEVRGVNAGSPSRLRASTELSVGVSAPGTLRVRDRAKASSGDFVSIGGVNAAQSGRIEILTGAELTAASVTAAHGNFVVDGVAAGTPSTAIVFGDVTIESDATLEVRSGGVLTAGKLVVEGIGDIVGLFPPATRSRLTALELLCGDTASSIFRIRDGALAESVDATIGRGDGCDVFIFGNPTPGAVDWAIQRDLTIGSAGALHFCPGPGLVTVGGLLTIEPNGVVEGNGTVRPQSLVNNGTTSVSCSIGTLVVEGDYRQTGQGRIVVEAAGPGDVDVLRVTGATVLDGTLEVHFVDGYLPSAGDFLPFLDLEGSITGAFQRITVAGVDEELVVAPGVVGGLTGLTVLTAAKACDGACEQCDNCLDDDGNGLVDRADPDCAAAADGGGIGNGDDPAARKAVAKCGATMATAGAKLAALVAKSLQRCTDAVLACVQTKPGDAACVAKAQATCAKATAGLAPDGSARRKARATIAKACGAKNAGEPPAVPLATIVAATGLGFDAEVARCAALATPVLASIDDVVACIDRATTCRASALLATRVPRAAELLTAGGAAAAPLSCLPSGDADGGASGDPKTTGKRLAKCQKAIAALGAKLTARLTKGYAACAGAVRTCLQSADPAACRAKAETTCVKATRTLPTLAGAPDPKLLASIRKACGTLDPAVLQDATGLGFGARDGRCAALGVPAIDGATALATCLSREHVCGTATLVEAATPRVRELLAAGGVALE